MPTPEDRAREKIDQALEKSGWKVQDTKSANLSASRGIALRNFPLASGYGFADYLLYIDGKAAGVIEPNKEGVTLWGADAHAVSRARHIVFELPSKPASSTPSAFGRQSYNKLLRKACEARRMSETKEFNAEILRPFDRVCEPRTTSYASSTIRMHDPHCRNVLCDCFRRKDYL